MNKFFCAAVFCASFFSYASQNGNNPTLSPRRGRDLGDTGANHKPADAIKRRTSSSSGPKFSREFLKEENLNYDGRLSPGSRTADANKDQK